MPETEHPPDLAAMDLVVRGASQLLTVPASLPDSAAAEERLGIIPDGALAAREGRVAWTGPSSALPEGPPPAFRGRWLEAGGRAVIPGLVDCHTHLVHAGSRAAEFEMRLQGRSYEEIARAGGGILSTVAATRRASAAELEETGMARLDEALRQGVTTVEVKSGYGLEIETEVKILEVAARLDRRHPAGVVATFLGAHELPAEHRGPGGRERYLEIVTREMIPEVGRRGLAEFCDVFCERGVFSVEEARRVLEAGMACGLRPKVHADQFTDLGGAALAADLGAASADHLEKTGKAGMARLAAAGVPAVLLPTCNFFLGLPPEPRARILLEKGVRVAVATDFNPGSSMTQSLPLALTMACTLLRLTPAEALLGATRYAAAALGREGRIGTLDIGARADVVVLESADWRSLVYHFGRAHAWTVIKAGQVVAREGRILRPAA